MLEGDGWVKVSDAKWIRRRFNDQLLWFKHSTLDYPPQNALSRWCAAENNKKLEGSAHEFS